MANSVKSGSFFPLHHISENIKRSVKAIEEDFLASPMKTTPGKIQKLFTSVMDALTFIKAMSAFLSVSTFIFTYYIHSYCPIIAPICLPVMCFFGLFMGSLTRDCHKAYQGIRTLNNYVAEKYLDQDNPCSFDENAYKQWKIFSEKLAENTWIIDPLLRESLIQPVALNLNRMWRSSVDRFVHEVKNQSPEMQRRAGNWIYNCFFKGKNP